MMKVFLCLNICWYLFVVVFCCSFVGFFVVLLWGFDMVVQFISGFSCRSIVISTDQC